MSPDICPDILGSGKWVPKSLGVPRGSQVPELSVPVVKESR